MRLSRCVRCRVRSLTARCQVLVYEVNPLQDRRGVYARCAITGTEREVSGADRTLAVSLTFVSVASQRMIALECLSVPTAPDVQFDANDPQHIACALRPLFSLLRHSFVTQCVAHAV